MLKAVIFDMDGVIIDSEPLHARAGVLAMREFGINLPEEYCYSFIGSTDKHMLEVIRQEYRLTASIEELLAANTKAKQYLVEKEGYPPIPFVRELMEHLHQNNILLAIASSSPMNDILATVKQQNLQPFLTKVVSGREVAHPKPAPDVFLLAAKELNVKPEECLVIEDSYNGLHAAKTAGMARIAFYNPNSGMQDLSEADYIVEGFEEVDISLLRSVYQHSFGKSAVIAANNEITIRELSIEDIAQLTALLSKPEVAKYAMEPVRSPEEWKEFIASYIKNAYHFRGYGLWGIFENKSGKLIGRCGFEDGSGATADGLELGYLLDPLQWGKNIAYTAVASIIEYARYRINPSKIYAVIAEDNLRSIHLAERLHMQYAGTVTRNTYPCRIYVIHISDIDL